ncbi:cyclase family protein [Microbacterium sp. GXF0217]
MPENADRANDRPVVESALSLPIDLCTWERWGADDTAGALNYITPQVMKESIGTVSVGRSVSLSWDIDPHMPDEEDPPARQMLRTGESVGHRPQPEGADASRLDFASERIAMSFHGYTITHIDALSHCFWDGLMYGGRRADEVTAADGATIHDVRSTQDGITTRGVLIDAAGFYGRRWLDPGETVSADDIRRIEDAHGFRIQQGDAVFLRTGFGRRRREHGPSCFDDGYPGWDVSCLPLFAEREVSLIGSDTANDALPNPYAGVGMPMPIHAISIVAMGLRLIDNCDLEPLSETSRELGRSTFLLSVPALRLVGSTGSPVNPVAVF